MSNFKVSIVVDDRLATQSARSSAGTVMTILGQCIFRGLVLKALKHCNYTKSFAQILYLFFPCIYLFTYHLFIHIIFVIILFIYFIYLSIYLFILLFIFYFYFLGGGGPSIMSPGGKAKIYDDEAN